MEEPDFSSPVCTSGSSTDGGGAVPDLPWFLVFVRPRAEKAVRDRFLGLGLEAYAATHHETHVWRRGERRRIEKVLIPSIVFVRMEKKDRTTVEHSPGVVSLMTDPARRKPGMSGWDTLARVSHFDMQVFMQMLLQEDTEVCFTARDFTIGEQVRIKDFDPAFSQAQVVRLYGDARPYVGLRVSFLGCAYMQLPIDRIAKL